MYNKRAMSACRLIEGDCMPELVVFAHDAFPAALHWQAISFMRIVWPYIDAGLPNETYSADLSPVHFALVEGSFLLSYAAVTKHTIAQRETEYRVYGLGNVLTYPASRHQGFGGQVIAAADRYIDRSDADVSALFCTAELEPFYARYGWRRAAETFIISASNEKMTPLDELRMMRFISEKGLAGRQQFMSDPLHIRDIW